MTVQVPALGLVLRFAQGEEMRSEISTKFTRRMVRAELAEAGFTLDHWCTDPVGRFALSLASRI